MVKRKQSKPTTDSERSNHDIEIKSHGLEHGGDYHHHIQKRMTFALTKFNSEIKRVTVVLSDLNGPKGGQDKQCKIVVHLPGQQEIVISETQSDMLKAADRAIHRTSYTVQQRLKRRHRLLQRGRPSQMGAL